MRLNSTGLGIGTTSPTQKLDVVLSSATAYSSGVTGNGLRLYNSSTTTGQYVGITFSGEPTAGNAGIATIMATTTGSGNMDLIFSTRGSSTLAERARIDSSGNLLVGTTSVIQGGKYSSSFDGSISNGIVLQTTLASAGTGFIRFVNSAGTSQGEINATTTSVVAYLTTSDYRLKNTIAPMTGALAKVAQLKPVTYKWNSDGSDGQGFIAHELAEVCPDAVSGEKDAVDEDGNPKYQGIDTSFLVATLTAALQELNAKFDAYVASHP